jgi:hypothetical protein
MTEWYKAIRMSEEVFARHYCSGVDHLSGEVLYSSREV